MTRNIFSYLDNAVGSLDQTCSRLDIEQVFTCFNKYVSKKTIPNCFCITSSG